MRTEVDNRDIEGILICGGRKDADEIFASRLNVLLLVID
jgi:hypothetical protein